MNEFLLKNNIKLTVTLIPNPFQWKDEILGTKTDIKDGKYTSQMIGKNCKNEEKVKRIQEVIKNHNLEIDYDLSYAYSDSLHDIPMLKMVKNRIKIDTKDGHMSTFEIE